MLKTVSKDLCICAIDRLRPFCCLCCECITKWSTTPLFSQV